MFSLSLAIGVRRILKKLPPPYRILQRIDGQLGFQDAISTAWYFSEMAEAGTDQASIREAQRSEAERLARAADPKRALPFVVPRSAYIAAAAVFIAGTLFLIRYGVRQSLDLRPPVTQALVEFFRPSEQMVKAWEEPPPDSPAPLPSEQLSEQEQRRERELDQDAESRLAAMEALKDAGDELATSADRSLRDREGEGDWNDAEKRTDPPGDRDESQKSPPPPPGSKAVDPETGEEPPGFPEQQDNDLLRKMQDAFANLMNKLNIPPKAGKGRRQSEAEQESTDGTGQESQEQASEKTDGAPQGQGAPSAAPDGAEMQPGGQQAQAGQGEGEESDQAGEQSANSAAGQKDGAKQLRAAEQQEAMGKLDEILGKRAENLKGEIMVEVSSGAQELRTAYTESESAPRAGGGEIHRDEVPLALRPYVQRYFDEVRKGEEPTGQ